MLTNDGSQILTAAIAKNAANDNFVLSKRVAILVCLEVAGRRVFAVRFWRDDWQNAMDQQLLADSVAIVALVGEKQFGLANRNGQQIRNSTVIRSLPTGQDKAKRASLTVRAGVDFCRKTAA